MNAIPPLYWWQKAVELVPLVSGARPQRALAQLADDPIPTLFAICWADAMRNVQAVAERAAHHVVEHPSALGFVALQHLVERGADLAFVEGELYRMADRSRRVGFGVGESTAGAVLQAMARNDAPFASIRGEAVRAMAVSEIALRIVQSAERSGWRSRALAEGYVALLVASHGGHERREVRERLGKHIDAKWLGPVLAAAATGLASKRAADVCETLARLHSLSSRECASLVPLVLQCMRANKNAVVESATRLLQHWLHKDDEDDAKPLIEAMSRSKHKALQRLLVEAKRHYAAQRGDVSAMLAGHDTPLARVACAHGMVAAWHERRQGRAKRDFEPLMDVVLPLLASREAQVRLGALETLAACAERGANVEVAGDAARRSLGEDAGIGAAAAKMLGFGAHASPAFVTMLEREARGKKRAVRQEAAFALGLAYARAQRWDELAALFGDDALRVHAFAGLTFRDLPPQHGGALLAACRRARFDVARLVTHNDDVLSLFRMDIADVDSRQGLGSLCDLLSSEHRFAALNYLAPAARRGAKLHDIVVALAGALPCGDYREHPSHVLRTLEACALHGTEVTVAIPFVAPYAAFTYPGASNTGTGDIRSYAARILSKAVTSPAHYAGVRAHVLVHLRSLSTESDAASIDAGRFCAQLEASFGDHHAQA